MEEAEIKRLVKDLWSHETKAAGEAWQKLSTESRESRKVEQFLPELMKMVEDENSYVRNRGLLLTAANIRGAEANFLEKNLPIYLRCLADEKAITARQCLKGLAEIAMVKPEWRETIGTAVRKMKVDQYTESMRPLIEKDRRVLQEILLNK